MTDRAPKPCASCGREITWRRKWARDWPRVRFCSAACRRRRAGGADAALERAMLDLLRARGPNASICPSEAARAVDPAAWRERMEDARRAARRLAAAGTVEVTQRGRVVDPSSFRGPIRLRRAKAAMRTHGGST